MVFGFAFIDCLLMSRGRFQINVSSMTRCGPDSNPTQIVNHYFFCIKTVGNCMALDDTGKDTKADFCDEKKTFFCAQVSFSYLSLNFL